ncbi:unnamed protein product, partial [marine sediment metagenome]
GHKGFVRYDRVYRTPNMTNNPNSMKMIPTTRFTALIGIRSAILLPARTAIEFMMKKPMIAPMKIISGNGD